MPIVEIVLIAQSSLPKLCCLLVSQALHWTSVAHVCEEGIICKVEKVGTKISMVVSVARVKQVRRPNCKAGHWVVRKWTLATTGVLSDTSMIDWCVWGLCTAGNMLPRMMNASSKSLLDNVPLGLVNVSNCHCMFVRKGICHMLFWVNHPYHIWRHLWQQTLQPIEQ
jgi:hypothetical protein